MLVETDAHCSQKGHIGTRGDDARVLLDVEEEITPAQQLAVNSRDDGASALVDDLSLVKPITLHQQRFGLTRARRSERRGGLRT